MIPPEIHHEHVEQVSRERFAALQQAAKELGGITVEVIAREGEEFTFQNYQVTVGPDNLGVLISGTFPERERTGLFRDRTRQIMEEKRPKPKGRKS
jgi:hypothetical protein